MWILNILSFMDICPTNQYCLHSPVTDQVAYQENYLKSWHASSHAYAPCGISIFAEEILRSRRRCCGMEARHRGVEECSSIIFSWDRSWVLWTQRQPGSKRSRGWGENDRIQVTKGRHTAGGLLSKYKINIQHSPSLALWETCTHMRQPCVFCVLFCARVMAFKLDESSICSTHL